MIDTRSSRPFDPQRDMCEVDQFGYVNLVEAYATGTIAGDLNPSQLYFNDIEDPASIYGKPADEFDAIKFGNDITRRGQVSEDVAE